MGKTIGMAEFEDLYLATARDVFTYVRRRIAGDAEDLVAEVYVIAWRRRSELPSPGVRRAWLFGVARQLLKAEGRHRQRGKALINELSTRPAPPANERTDERTATIVTAALGRLAPNHREILQLVAWEGLTPTELAVALGIRPGAARVRLHRARQALGSDPEIQALVESSATTAVTSTR